MARRKTSEAATRARTNFPLSYASMLGRIGSALRARPFLGACTSATVKTSAADVMVQTVIEGRGVDEVDRRRLAAFSIFGCLWMGAGQYVLYCRVFEALLPARTVLHSAGKMALDQFGHVPLLFLPVFYSVDAWVRGHEIVSQSVRQSVMDRYLVGTLTRAEARLPQTYDATSARSRRRHGLTSTYLA